MDKRNTMRRDVSKNLLRQELQHYVCKRYMRYTFGSRYNIYEAVEI